MNSIFFNIQKVPNASEIQHTQQTHSYSFLSAAEINQFPTVIKSSALSTIAMLGEAYLCYCPIEFLSLSIASFRSDCPNMALPATRMPAPAS